MILERDMLDVILFVKPGQIYLDIRSGSGELNIQDNHSDWISYIWSGNILFDGGTDQKSICGVVWDRLIMDCNPGTLFEVTSQKESEENVLRVDIYADEIN